MIRHRRALLGVALAGLWALTAVPVALAARKWTLDASPTSIAVDDPVVVTLTVQNVGGDGGGDEITCVTIDVPATFTISGASVVSVKGVTSPASHGWIADVNGARATFKNPSDHDPLVGPPVGDQAMFRVSGTATSGGTQSWSGGAADKPGASGSANCGSGTFPKLSVSIERLGPGPDPDADARADADPATDRRRRRDPRPPRRRRRPPHPRPRPTPPVVTPTPSPTAPRAPSPTAASHADDRAHGDGPPRLHAVIAAHGDARRERVGDARRVPVSVRTLALRPRPRRARPHRRRVPIRSPPRRRRRHPHPARWARVGRRVAVRPPAVTIHRPPHRR